MLNDFIAKQPATIYPNTIVDEQRVSIPVKIDKTEFQKEFHEDITATDLTPEKALYVATVGQSKKTKSVNELLRTGR